MLLLTKPEGLVLVPVLICHELKWDRRQVEVEIKFWIEPIIPFAFMPELVVTFMLHDPKMRSAQYMGYNP